MCPFNLFSAGGHQGLRRVEREAGAGEGQPRSWRHLAGGHHRGQQSVHRPLRQVHVSCIIDAATYRC